MIQFWQAVCMYWSTREAVRGPGGGGASGARDTGMLELRKGDCQRFGFRYQREIPRREGKQGACTWFVRDNLLFLSADLDLVSGFKVTGSICFFGRTMAKEMVSSSFWSCSAAFILRSCCTYFWFLLRKAVVRFGSFQIPEPAGQLTFW